MTTLLSSAELQKPSKNSWLSLLGWGLVLAFLAWSWEGAEMRPAQLWKDAGNMAQFAADFFPPDFRDWRLYLKEMVVTVQIAVWGTVLAVICGVPLAGPDVVGQYRAVVGVSTGAPFDGRAALH